METTFPFELFSPTRQVPAVEVTLVELPAIDGEVGILAGHENIVGLLGTGPLKYVAGGNDYWLMVSSGAYQVVDRKLVVIAELIEDSKGVDPEATRAHIAQLETAMAGKALETPEFTALELDYKREKARLEVHRRVELVN